MQEPHHEGMLPVVESVDVAKRDDVHKLKPSAVGLIGVLFLTVTGSAPISAMLFNPPISVGFGNGIGTPAGFIVAAVVLTVFGVASVAMARKVTTAGGFYSFISHRPTPGRSEWPACLPWSRPTASSRSPLWAALPTSRR